SPYSRSVWTAMPAVLASPRHPQLKDKTFYQVVSGHHGLFSVFGGNPTTAGITRGLPNCVLVVEGANAVDWASPNTEISYMRGVMPALGGIFGGTSTPPWPTARSTLCPATCTRTRTSPGCYRRPVTNRPRRTGRRRSRRGPCNPRGRSVARYFKYRSVADVETAARDLGLDLRFSDDFTPLFRPVGLGPLRA